MESGDVDTRHTGEGLLVAAVLWILSLIILVLSWDLTFQFEPLGGGELTWLVAPGFLPLLLSGGLLLMLTAALAISIYKRRALSSAQRANLVESVLSREAVTTLLHMVLLCLFVFVLLGRVHFGAAAAIYLIAAMLLARAAKPYIIVLISVSFAGAVTWVFGTLMKIPLP